MGNRVMCGAPQSCVDECARLHFETRSREADEPECDPAGAVFQETLLGLPPRDQEGLIFAGTANLVALRWLLLLGANPKARDRNGTTLLHAACRSGSFLVAQELLRRELPLDATDSAGWTPLHVAAMMGRRELTQLLLQAQINPHVQNKRGATPLDLCSDVSTREALRTFALKVPEVASRMNSVEEFQRLTRVQGEVGEDPTATCEPFFVPRQPVFEDEAHYKVLVSIGLEMAHKSAAHALAFFVATGVVHDHPTDLSAFLIENKVDPSQLGEFMGEDFSLAQTLRLAFVHTMDLAGTGVVGALRKVFSYMRPPTELSKIDRITAAAAHLWWRTHDLDDAQPYLAGMQEADEALEWTLFAEAEAGSGQEPRPNSSWFAGQDGEVSGARLRSVLHSVEGLARLLFSTVLLCWNIRRVLPDSEGGSNARLSFQEWMEVNSKIEADGTTPSVAVQKCIYNTLLQDECPELLPNASAKKTAMPEFREVPEDTSALRAAGQGAGDTLTGWASIPAGGLERYDVPMPHGHQGGLSGAKLSHCVLSETSSSFLDRGHKNGINLLQPEMTTSSGEAVWMSLKYAFWLFLSTSPDDPAPYVFIRLQDTVLREANLREKSLVLAGRMKKSADNDAAGELWRNLCRRSKGSVCISFRPIW
ncbi:Tnks2 [Symbiodinium pilosum]|uniref:Tnks2 protein n=1 Tax=Symbiodinium pilosum TaxID=2952 RepID=A0A812MCJ1_SYMPI|nr:Tnks2 [Symbiodinium pilosum]